jgi:hypothetical protein
MINNSWNIQGNANPYLRYEHGWANEEAAGKKYEPIKKLDAVLRTGLTSKDNVLTTTDKYYPNSVNASRMNTTAYMHQVPPNQNLREYAVPCHIIAAS